MSAADRLRQAALAALLLAWPALVPGAHAAGEPASSAVVIDFFFEPGCSDCALVRAEILPELEVRYGGFYVLNEYDAGVPENYLKLAAYQESLGIASNASVSMVLDGRVYLDGIDRIRDDLFASLDRLVAERLAGESPPGPPAGEVPGPDLARRTRRFTVLGVVTAGLVDGINPCAISTLVFFVSLLSVLKVSRRQILTVGLSFVTASFLTYLAIGFGLLRALHMFSGFEKLRTGVNWGMTGVLAVFAFLSFRDAWRYRRSRSARDVSLQLPEGIKMRIHRIMRGGLGFGSLLLGSLFIGSAVTMLESVCTGQVYIPTLVMVIKSGQADAGGFLLLILYNLMFQVPIVAVFALIFQGMRTQRLLQWSARNVVVSKVLMGLFFVGMALLIYLL